MKNRLLVLCAAAMLMAGTQASLAQQTKPLKLTLNFLAAAPNAGFMMA